VQDNAGNAMSADYSFNFFALAGDANHDRHVDLTDFTLLAANFNGQNKTFSQADFNYDGKVDLTDFTILAASFNRSLAAPTTTTAATPSPAGATSSAMVTTSDLFASTRIASDRRIIDDFSEDTRSAARSPRCRG